MEDDNRETKYTSDDNSFDEFFTEINIMLEGLDEEVENLKSIKESYMSNHNDRMQELYKSIESLNDTLNSNKSNEYNSEALIEINRILEELDK